MKLDVTVLQCHGLNLCQNTATTTRATATATANATATATCTATATATAVLLHSYTPLLRPS